MEDAIERAVPERQRVRVGNEQANFPAALGPPTATEHAEHADAEIEPPDLDVEAARDRAVDGLKVGGSPGAVADRFLRA